LMGRCYLMIHIAIAQLLESLQRPHHF
jgi:hypothetical protein